MKLPWRSREETDAVVPEEEAVDAGPQTRNHRSPGLLEALTALRSEGSSSVLDLGQAVGDNIAFFSGRAARLQIAAVLGSGDGNDTAGRALKILRDLETERGPVFDLVLAWDVLDYFEGDGAVALVDLLARLCRPDARLHLIVSGTGTMPARPTRYRIVDSGNLSYERGSDEVVGSRNQTPAMVEKTLDGFRIEHSFVLRHGVHEYVAARKA